MLRRAALHALLALGSIVFAGCAEIEDLIGGGPIAPLEVWNTTTEPIFLIDKEGRRIDVPACGHADPAPMRLDMVEVRTEVGYIYGFGTRPKGARQYLVFVALDGESNLTTVPPLSIPPCQGRPNVQPGV